VTGWRKARAHQVRTGDIIATAWSPRHLTLTVDYPTWEHFTSPEGVTNTVIRFTGTDSSGTHVDKGWGVRHSEWVFIAGTVLAFDIDTFGLVLTAADDTEV
jgi:hypothetical protein